MLQGFLVEGYYNVIVDGQGTVNAHRVLGVHFGTVTINATFDGINLKRAHKNGARQ
jgi:hypothetical protein